MAEYTPIRLSYDARQIDRERMNEALRPLEITLDDDAKTFVTLRPSVPWVENVGWLNFIGNWHDFAQTAMTTPIGKEPSLPLPPERWKSGSRT